MAGKSNYFIGDDPAKRHTHVPMLTRYLRCLNLLGTRRRGSHEKPQRVIENTK
jgi:hypothetical protein